MSVKLYVGNLSFQTSSTDLQELFAQTGTVESAAVVEDRDTGRSRAVLERLGMRFVRDANYYDFACVHYAIARADWHNDDSYYRVIKSSRQ